MFDTSARQDPAPSLASSPLTHWLSSPIVVFGIAAALVALRALVFLRFEELAFDSDQAIIGLMAKHFASGRAFPLFFYGQRYMLGVESWAAAPFFLIAGPTVRALRLSILAWNLAFAFLLLVGLQRDAGLRPYRALA